MRGARFPARLASETLLSASGSWKETLSILPGAYPETLTETIHEKQKGTTNKSLPSTSSAPGVTTPRGSVSPVFGGWRNRLGGRSLAGPACGRHSHQGMSDGAHARDAARAATPPSHTHWDRPCATHPAAQLLSTASLSCEKRKAGIAPHLAGSQGLGGAVRTTSSLQPTSPSLCFAAYCLPSPP